MRVFIYWNLHRACWSIKALDGASKGLVVAHAVHWQVEGVRFKVSEAGRQRVLREKRKNVHAGVVGTLVAWQEGEGVGPWVSDRDGGAWDTLVATHRPSVFDAENVAACEGSPWADRVSYNPHKGPTFVSRPATRVAPDAPWLPVKGARCAWAVGRTVTALSVVSA